MRVHFGCAETAPGTWAIRLDITSFETPSCWEELKQICLQHDKVLVLGLFDWSNYSHTVVNDIIDHKNDFEKHSIGLAAFGPSSFTQIRQICPYFISYCDQANTEPMMFLLEGEALKKARFGPIDSKAILNWVLTDSDTDHRAD